MEQPKEVIEKGDMFIVYKPEEYEDHPEGQAMIAVSSFMYNEVLSQISFIPICTENLKQVPSHIKLKAYNGYAYCERLRKLPKWCVGKYLGKLTPKDVSEIDRQLSIMFEINCPANNISSFESAFAKTFERNEKKTLDKQKRELQEKTAEITKSYEEKTAELAKSYEEKISELNERLSLAEKQELPKISELKASYENELKKQKENYEREVQKLNDKFSSLLAVNEGECDSRIKETEESHNREVAALKKLVESLRTENDRLHVKADELAGKVSEITKENEDLKKNGNAGSGVEVELLKIELDAYKSKLKEVLGGA